MNEQVMHQPMKAEGYEDLAYVLEQAFEQAARGKGKERHANQLPFNEQPIMTLQELYGPGFALGQAAKKTQEAQRMGTDAAVRELLGAINYIAGAIIHIQSMEQEEPESEDTGYKSAYDSYLESLADAALNTKTGSDKTRVIAIPVSRAAKLAIINFMLKRNLDSVDYIKKRFGMVEDEEETGNCSFSDFEKHILSTFGKLYGIPYDELTREIQKTIVK